MIPSVMLTNGQAHGEYSIANRMAIEAEATELCLQDLEIKSASNDPSSATALGENSKSK